MQAYNQDKGPDYQAPTVNRREALKLGLGLGAAAVEVLGKGPVLGSIDALVGGGEAHAQTPNQVAALNVAQTNLGRYGVPDINRMGYLTGGPLDLTPRINGEESRLDFYEGNGHMVAVYTLGGDANKTFAIGHDNNGDRRIDELYFALEGPGQFTPVPLNSDIVVPDWVQRS